VAAGRPRRGPDGGSAILAGVLLKMGTYGFMKLGFPLFPEAAKLFTPLVMSLAVISIVYGACLALVQTDIKKIIAYSSISHLGYVMLGLASLDLIGIQGAVIQMVSHGLTAAGLFMMIGMIYERCHSRDLAAYGGLAKILPLYSVFFLLLTLGAIGLRRRPDSPASSCRCWARSAPRGERYGAGRRLAAVAGRLAVTGVVLGALYMLWFAQALPVREAQGPHLPITDLSAVRSRCSPRSSSRCSRWASSPTNP